MKTLTRIAAVCAVVAVSGATSASAQEAATTDLGTSQINRMSAVYGTNQLTCGTSVTKLLSKKIKTKKKGSVSIHFQGEFGSSNSCDAQIFVRMDGKTIPGPGRISQGNAVVAQGKLAENGTHGFVFVKANVPAGKHTFEVDCLCTASNIKVSEREMVLYHR